MSEPFEFLSFSISAKHLRKTEFFHPIAIGSDFFMVLDMTYFDLIDTWPKVCMFRPVGGKNLKCFSAQKKVCRFHLFFHDLTTNIVKIRCNPTAIFEAARCIFLRSTRCLHYSI